ncbi:Alpha/Beta hydrolase protein [Phlebopus sp. FC_14]|nr:Alpha/Beta hydrolase protein [Phlebopus sp. FC_14]
MAGEQELGAEYQTIFDPHTCTRRGLCPVTQIRHQGEPFESHSLYFELHGSGPDKVVFIMGLNSTSFAWLPQVDHFGKQPHYSVLVFDNRGVGMSGSPRGPYTTSGMAEDVIALLDYIGWMADRDLHVVGISLGGMIAQGQGPVHFIHATDQTTELAYRIPGRISSLSLVVTTPGGRPWSNLPSWKGVSSLTRLLTMTDLDLKLPIIMGMLFPAGWLDQKADNDPLGRTNREIQSEIYRRRLEIARPQTLLGSVSQMWAGITHHVTPERLRKISSSIPKVLILTGDEDHLVDPAGSVYLKTHMPEAEYQRWEKTGHGISGQWTMRFNDILQKTFRESKVATK